MKRLILLLMLPTLLLAQEQPKIGLVLSGGGAKGFAHVGVLKELEKAGIQIDYIGGTSMGAIVGGLYASGYSADQIEEVINETDFMSLLQDKVKRNSKPFFMKQHGEKYAITLPIRKGGIGLPMGLSKGQNVLNFFTELLAPVDGIHDFSKLPIPFYCIGTNIETGEEELLDKGSLPLALRASGAFPSLLNPVDIDGKVLVDGGVVNNFPVDVMKKKGMDLIIGVNVQGELLKRKELASVSSILLQIINFQMYEKSDQHVKLLNFELVPNVKEYSVISFDKSEEIIAEGVHSFRPFKARFDSIAKLQKVKRMKPKIDFKEQKFLVDRVVVKGNNNYTDNYVLGKLDLRENDTVSYKDISKKISVLTATGNFDRIDYLFTNSFKGKKLEIKVKEDQLKSFLRLGLHFDPLYKSAVLLNYSHKKLLSQNDELSFDVGIGDKIRYDFNYFIDNGWMPSYGFRSRYNRFNTSFLSFEDPLISRINIKYIDFTNAFFVQSTVARRFAFGLGVENKKIKISTDTFSPQGEEELIDNSNYLNLFSFLKLDTYNKKMFPTDGYFANIGFKWFVWSDRNHRLDNFVSGGGSYNQFSQLTGSFGFAKTFFDRLTLQYTSDAGYTLGDLSSELFDYRLGGNNQNFINNFVPFYGYDINGLNNQSFLRSEFNFRYRVFNKHYASFIANYARVENDVFDGGDLFRNTKSGYAVGYGVESFLGPIELKYTWSPDHNERYLLFNLGFWF